MESHPPANQAIAEQVQSTQFVDTHEHLLEESQRLHGLSYGAPLFTCDDWAYLFVHYALDDLTVAGMPITEAGRFTSPDVSAREKWTLFAPYWPNIRQTGYGRAVLLSIRKLFGEDELSAESVERITDHLRKGVQKGYYYHILHDVAGVESCQVNSLDRTFRVTEYPDLLFQDLSTIPLGSEVNLDTLRRETGLPISDLQGAYQAIDWYFEQYGQQAIATKNQSAYARRLNYAQVTAEEAAPLFERLARGYEINANELKAIQDHLFRYTVSRATAYGLPVKLHTGYYAGTGSMPLERVSRNLQDLCPLLQDFPNTTFVLMHITYPYQDELIALAKHYANVYVDLCWAWIVNPVATVRFVKEFLAAVPANKLLTFGGDYTAVENVVGHAELARHGLIQALSELVVEGWLSEHEAVSLVEPLMRGNAYATFHITEKAALSASLTKPTQ